MESTEKNWDRMAKAYEDFTEGEDSYSMVIEWPCVRGLLPDLKDKSVLDLGCGTGRFTFLLEEAGAKEAVGVDLSGEMLALAKQKALARGSRARFVQGDAGEVRFDHPFDFVFASTVTHYMKDLDAFFQNVRRALKPGGTFVLSAMHPVYTAQCPVRHGDAFPEDDEWTVRYLDKSERAYIQPWIEYNDETVNFLSYSYHHTLADYFAAITRAGFAIKALREPAPPESWKDECPGRYDNFVETPSYLVLKLQRD